MKLLTTIALTLALVSPASAHEFFMANLTNDHEIAANWNSSVEATGSVFIELHEGEVSIAINLTGLKAADLASEFPGPFHIHNFPQGGENFIVQGFSWVITDTEAGVRVTSEGLPPEAITGQDFDFVLSEIQAGNAYFAVHTVGENCSIEGDPMSCEAPITALSGTLQ